MRPRARAAESAWWARRSQRINVLSEGPREGPLCVGVGGTGPPRGGDGAAQPGLRGHLPRPGRGDRRKAGVAGTQWVFQPGQLCACTLGNRGCFCSHSRMGQWSGAGVSRVRAPHGPGGWDGPKDWGLQGQQWSWVRTPDFVPRHVGPGVGVPPSPSSPLRVAPAAGGCQISPRTARAAAPGHEARPPRTTGSPSAAGAPWAGGP